MFEHHKLFRLMVDEVEKSLMLTDLAIAAEYAGLVEDIVLREDIFGRIKLEHAAALDALRLLTGSAQLGARFPNMYGRFQAQAPQLTRINHLQVALLRQARAEPGFGASVPLMQSMNCIAAGLGWTG